MNWFIVDKEYVNYLSQFDEKVGFVEYGNRIKLHVGILNIMFHILAAHLVASNPLMYNNI